MLVSITLGTLPDRLLAEGASYGPGACYPSALAFFLFSSLFFPVPLCSFGTVGGCSSRSPCCELYIAPGRAGPVSRAIYRRSPIHTACCTCRQQRRGDHVADVYRGRRGSVHHRQPCSLATRSCESRVRIGAKHIHAARIKFGTAQQPVRYPLYVSHN